MAIEKDLLDQLLAGRDPKDVFNLKTVEHAAQGNKPLFVVVAAAAALGLLTGRATAGPPFVTDDPEPVPFQHFEFYNLYLRAVLSRGPSAAAVDRNQKPGTRPPANAQFDPSQC